MDFRAKLAELIALENSIKKLESTVASGEPALRANISSHKHAEYGMRDIYATKFSEKVEELENLKKSLADQKMKYQQLTQAIIEHMRKIDLQEVLFTETEVPGGYINNEKHTVFSIDGDQLKSFEYGLYK